MLIKSLSERGIHAVSYSIERLTAFEADAIVEESDLVGFGYPVYGSDVPHIMKEFLDSLSIVENKNAFVFCSQWLWSGDGARVGADLVKPKGYRVFWGEHFLMPCNVCVSVTWFLPFTNNRRRIKRNLIRTEKSVRSFVERLVSGRPALKGFNPVSRFLGGLQRVPFRQVFHRLRYDISVDSSSCIKCGRCAEFCPSGNLRFDGSGFQTTGSCILCLRCYNYCPVSAVKYMNRVHNKKRGTPYKGPNDGFALENLRAP